VRTPSLTTKSLLTVLGDIVTERERQDAKWGEQNPLDGTGSGFLRLAVQPTRESCERAFGLGVGTWRHILDEELAEAFAEEDPQALRAELIQVAAVAVAWVEAIDRRESS
jgi:hypothetical protein